VADGIRWVGLDVHARESTLAVFDQATGEVRTSRVVGRPHELLERLMEIPVPARMVYDVNGHRFLPKYGHRFSPPAAIFSPHWWP